MVRLEDVSLGNASEIKTFQFHYGTIRRHLQTSQIEHQVYFNSTMVRLEVNVSACLIVRNSISIPLWYD